MITLLLLGSDSSLRARLGPMPGARVHGDFMESATDARPLLIHRRGLWSSGAVFVRRVRIKAHALTVSFSNKSQTGPVLTSIHGGVFFDGALYADNGGRLLARYEDASGFWRETSGHQLWSLILLNESAPAA